MSGGAVVLSVHLVDVNDATRGLSASLRLHDGADGTAPAALWRALSLAADSAAGGAVRDPPPKCTIKAAVAAAQKLDGSQLAVALDLYKRGPALPATQVVGLYLLAAPPPPQQPRAQRGQRAQSQPAAAAASRRVPARASRAASSQQAPASAPAVMRSPAITRHRAASKAAAAAKGGPKKSAPKKAAPTKAAPKKAAPKKGAPKKGVVSKGVTKRKTGGRGGGGSSSAPAALPNQSSRRVLRSARR